MNSVGIDISKGRSTIAAMRPFGEVVISPFEVRHTGSELSELARQLKSLNGETRVVMEATGNYHAAVVKSLHGAGLILFYLYWQIDMVTSVGVPVSMPSTSKSNLLCKREAEVSIVKVRVRVSPTSVLLVILKQRNHNVILCRTEVNRSIDIKLQRSLQRICVVQDAEHSGQGLASWNGNTCKVLMLTGRNRHKTPNLGINRARAVIRNGKHNVRASIRETVHRKSGEIRIKKLHLHITSKVSGSMVWVIDDRGSSRRVDFLNAADDLSILRLQNIFSFRCLSRSHDHILSDFPSIRRGNTQ